VWSDDGRRLAWIERRKKVYEINVLQIRGSS